MSNKAEQDLAAFHAEFVEGLGIDTLIGAQERALLQAAQGGTGTRIKYAAEDLAQSHGGPVVAGVLATAALANSGPTMAAANAESVGISGGTAPQAQVTRKAAARDRIVYLRPGQEIYDIAEVVAEDRGVNTMTEVGVIERASNVPSEAAAEHLPIGFAVHVPPKNAKAKVAYVVEPRGGNLMLTAEQNGLTLEQLLELNPEYKSHPDFVEAGARLRLSSSDPAYRPKAVIHHSKTHALAPRHDRHKRHVPHKTSTTEHKAPVLPVSPAAKPAAPVHVAKTKHAVAPRKAPAAVAKTAPRHHNRPHHALRPSRHVAESPKPETSHVKETYNIHSDVLTKSGLSTAALRYALKQMYGEPMADLAGDFHGLEQKFGINALYGAAAAAQESGGATSYLAQHRNNLYGMNAVDSDPNLAFGYASKAKSVMDFGKLLHEDYLRPSGQYWNGSTLHGIYVKYSSSHDTEASEIASIMNSLARHGEDFYQGHHHASAPAKPKPAGDGGHDFFRDFGHVWGEVQAAIGSTVVRHSGHQAKGQAYHGGGDTAIYRAALKYNPDSYSETMIASHDGVARYHIAFPKVGPKSLIDCSGLVNEAVSDATGGRDQPNENTKNERQDHKRWKQIRYSYAGQGDLIQPVIDGRVGNHVEIINKVKGNVIYTFGAHTSQVPQPEQVGPAKYIYNRGDIFLRYIGSGISHHTAGPAPGHKHSKKHHKAAPSAASLDPHALARAWNHPLGP